MSHQFDVVAVGGVVGDVTFYTNKGRVFKTPENLTEQRMLGFEYGAKIPIHEAYFTLGGGAANAANIFSLLELKTAILCRVGDDKEGENIRDTLKDKNIHLDFMQKDASLRSGVSFIICSGKKEHEHIAFTYRGANETLEITENILQRIDTHYYYVSSLSGDNWMRGFKALVSHAKKNHSKLAWNPGSAQIQAGKKMLENELKKIDILILNKDEAIEFVLTGIRIGKRNPRFLNKTLYLLNMLSDWGPKTVVITEGIKGASVLHFGKFYNTKSIKRKAINTTGVGDAFGATFVATLLENSKDVLRALRMSAINSASVVTRIGAQEGALSKKELSEKIKK